MFQILLIYFFNLLLFHFWKRTALCYIVGCFWVEITSQFLQSCNENDSILIHESCFIKLGRSTWCLTLRDDSDNGSSYQTLQLFTQTSVLLVIKIQSLLEPYLGGCVAQFAFYGAIEMRQGSRCQCGAAPCIVYVSMKERWCSGLFLCVTVVCMSD